MGRMEKVLADFGRDIGLEDLAPGDGASVQLRLESGALMGVSAQGEEAVLHYAEPVAYNAAELTFKAMRKVTQIASPADSVQFGLRTTLQGEWMVVSTRLPLDSFSVSEMHRLGNYLQAWLAFVRRPA